MWFPLKAAICHQPIIQHFGHSTLHSWAARLWLHLLTLMTGISISPIFIPILQSTYDFWYTFSTITLLKVQFCHWCIKKSLNAWKSWITHTTSSYTHLSPFSLPVQLPLGLGGCPVKERWTVSSWGSLFPWWHCLSVRRTGWRRGRNDPRKKNPHEISRVNSSVKVAEKEDKCALQFKGKN